MESIRSQTQTRRLLLVDPYPRNNPYHLTASERRAVWFPKLSLPVIAAYIYLQKYMVEGLTAGSVKG